MEGKPWLFNNNLFALKNLDGYNQIEKIQFNTETFWVQLHKLPIMCMNGFYSNLIGKTIEKVLEVDVEEDDTVCGHFLLVRIEINITKPLPRGRPLKVMGDNLWIPLKFEKLSRFCFNYGRIVHEMPCISHIATKDNNQ